MKAVQARVLSYIRSQRLIEAGDRVLAAVSGGADSVAMLCLLADLRPELAITLAVAHFHHQLRGAEAQRDEGFVRELAARMGLEFHSGTGDTLAFAREQKLSVETAARELRHQWFAALLKDNIAGKIATAHTQDDQAETVLMRVLRGAGPRGLAGIAPRQKEKSLVRPMLCVNRAEVEHFLREREQPWREDESNRDLHHTRNRIRHELLPLLERSYNPAVRQTLADLAEVARAEEEFWNTDTAELAARLVRSGHPARGGGRRSAEAEQVVAVDRSALLALPLARRRRLLRFMASRLGAALEFRHIQALLAMAISGKSGNKTMLPGPVTAACTLREFQMRRGPAPVTANYCYTFPVPGEVEVPELGTVVRARLVSPGSGISGYNSFQHIQLLDRALLAPELTVRNWHAGDRYFPAHTRSPKKVKELLQKGRIAHERLAEERGAWPVIESDGQLVWMRGFPAPQAFAARSGEAILIEEVYR